jgi:type I restriction enzyme R subunit
MTPNESEARKIIDQQLRDAGWSIRNHDGPVVRGAGAIAIREFPLSTGIADYLLVINGEAVGVL